MRALRHLHTPPTPLSRRAPGALGASWLLLAAAAAAWLPGAAGAQHDAPAADGGGLTDEDEASVERELLTELPLLSPVGNPERIAQLRDLAARLTRRRAYCAAAKHLVDIESMGGAVAPAEGGGVAAQVFYMCARTRLAQNYVAQAAEMLQRSMSLVGERPEHRDLLFKLAVVRARQAVDEADVAAVARNLEEAERLGADTGPGRQGRLADWAVPILNETTALVSTWARELVTAGDLDRAGAVATVALRFNPHDRIADSVQRDLFLRQVAMPFGVAAVALLVVLGLAWRLMRWLRLRQAAALAAIDDDETTT